ncbi:MAG: hypothetical protein RJB13_1928 [Pseudomonadota bacterium]|jgi:uncharacterized protein (TIRG00374 family)
MIKQIFKTFVFLATAFLFLFMMHRFGFLRWGDITQAFARHPKTLIGVCGVQVITAVVMMIRYWKLLNLFGVEADLRRSSAATFVSTALGQWFPGSMAVVEMMRVGLMVGVGSKSEKVSVGMASGIKARLAIVSIVDRLVGFFGILFTGLLASAGTLLFAVHDVGVFVLFVFSLGGVLGLIGLPFAVRQNWVKSFLRKKISVAEQRGADGFSTKGHSVLLHVESLRNDIEMGTRNPMQLVGPILLSVLSLLLTSAGLFMAARALSESLDFFQILCVFPIVSLASVLPLGFAGIGGYQLVMASVFGVFAVSPSVVASAGLLQSALLLLVNSLLGLAFLQTCSRQVRQALASS